MERGKPYLKVAALVSSVALVGAFVADRNGAFSKPVPAPQPDPQQAVAPAGPSGDPVITPADGPERSGTPTPAELNAAIMYGSKSAPAFVPTQPNTPGSLLPPQLTPVAPSATPDPNAKPPVFMSGPKSSFIYTPPPVVPMTQPGAQPAPPKLPPPIPNPAPNPPVFMGGSKSIGPLFAPPQTVPSPQPPAPQPPNLSPPPKP